MEILRDYIYEDTNNGYDSIFDEYIYLEMLCRHTDFYDLNRMFYAMSTERNEYSKLLFFDYYQTKIDFIRKFFDDIDRDIYTQIIDR